MLFGWFFAKRSQAEDHPPVTPEDLKMTSEPLAPGAPAIILYRQVDRDDQAGHEDSFIRIKILKEEGRSRADVEIPFNKGGGAKITHISARTIHPDGTVLEFTGKPFQKQIVKAKGLKYLALTFTLPDVGVGSIVEYSYRRENAGFDSHWILSLDLFTKHAQFSLRPHSDLALKWTWHALPEGAQPPVLGHDKSIHMAANNIPAFQVEDYMPPENERKSRIDFTYSYFIQKDPDIFWQAVGRRLNNEAERFIAKRDALNRAVAQIVSPADPPETKLQKLYSYTQSIRNLSYAVHKTGSEESKREKEKVNENVEDVIKRAYATDLQLNWLFLGLVRAAGFEAYEAYASDRQNYFFNRATMDSYKLDYALVLVKLNGTDIFCDPGVPFTPLGLVSWPETGVQALRLDKDGGTWITTMVPKSSASRTIHKADLTLSESGDLEGKLTVTFTGLKAMELRFDERDEDDADKKKTLEDEVKADVPVASEVELTNSPDWTSSAKPLVAEFKLRVENWSSAAGRKFTFPVGLFAAGEKKVFEREERIHPIYFEYPREQDDELSVTMPAGWRIITLPKDAQMDRQVIAYSLKAEDNKSTLQIRRTLSIDALYVLQESYPVLRNFFQNVRTTDEEQVLLQPASAAASN
jgi:hypothetical protein